MICRDKQFIRNIIRKCVTCKNYEGPYQYPVSPLLSELRMNSDFTFYTTEWIISVPFFIKSIFAKDCLTLFKVWVTLYTCGGTRGVILDIMHHINSTPLIKSFRQFVRRRGCPSVLISDNGRNFVSTETGQLVNGLGVDWSLDSR